MIDTVYPPPFASCMRNLRRPLLRLLALAFAVPALAPAAAAPLPPDVEVQSEDVARFFAVFEAAHGAPTAMQLQDGYTAPGTPALQDFVRERLGSAQRLAQKVAADPELFRRAQACAARIPEIRQRVGVALQRLAAVYPPARLPPVTILIGRGTSGGITSPAGVIIGLETLCKADWLQADIGDRFVHLIAHEYVHVQQPGAAVEAPADASLLYRALLEGGAEFVGELISGQVANVHLQVWTRGRECAIERDFAAAAAGSDTRDWLYNGVGDRAHPGDLGYWAGYRIARAYYAQAKDKQQALADLLDVRPHTAADFLRRSGWQPQLGCADTATSAAEAGATH